MMTFSLQPGGGFGPFKLGIPASQIRASVQGRWETKPGGGALLPRLRTVDLERSYWEHGVMVVAGESGTATFIEVKNRSVLLTHDSLDLWSADSIRELHRAGSTVETDDDGSYMVRDLAVVWYFDGGKLLAVASPSAEWLDAVGQGWRPTDPPT